ncbi:hypothetical protein PV10_08816 [Exophiala mesophila]|uniref:Uncharacterized protein n=1 Tax=Exophiala mesophila TaxID=212818 RepID=A0A0D1Z390_EXOME|nr:uncharacterized protein PV10_08816 [Exophiala mesophila]KIV89232.1 hypothetical protein PV10_08816 [Exophiala mesophila]
MESAIRFSVNSVQNSEQRFLHVDVIGKSFKLCKVTSQTKTDVEYETIHTSTKVPAFRAFDWHPIHEDLVVVGQAGGEATLLNIAEGQQDSLSFQVRSQRLCNAVALNTQNLLAAGLDRVRTDFCLNIWDFNQRLPPAGSKGFVKSYAEPIHKFASGEPITSLKFFHNDPQLLVAGVKGQFVRLYDLREPAAGNGLQFSTRCVHNLAIDWHDENYFASCYPNNDPAICVWDRRMISRVNPPHMSFGTGTPPESRQPEVSLEFQNPVQVPGVIWSLRFSKSQRGCLGVLSSTGHLKTYTITKEYTPPTHHNGHDPENDSSWDSMPPQDIFLDRVQEIAPPYSNTSTAKDEKARVVSFDFTTAIDRQGQPQIMTLDGHGHINIVATRPLPEPSSLSSIGQFFKGSLLVDEAVSSTPDPGEALRRVRGQAQQENKLKKQIKQARQSKSSTNKRASSLEDQEWHSDLGYYEENIPLNDVLTLTSTQRLRCEAGYLLNATKNKAIVTDSHWLQRLWAWVELAGKVARHGNMTQDNFDLSYMGVYGLWMEDVNPKNRTLGPTSHKLAKIMENLVRRLNIPPLQSVTTEYLANRLICLHVSGLAWSEKQVEAIVDHLVQQKDQVAKAAALAMFTSHRKYAYKALRSANASQPHKMLAMAIAGAAKRGRRNEEGAISTDDDSNTEDDWTETIASLAEDLTDPFARAILTYVRSGDWASVVEEESLPLKYRICIALRHLDDSKLTQYISHATRDAISRGDIEGVILTGTASQEAFELMANYVRHFGDLQTAVLALCPAIPRYVDDEKVVRTFTAWRETYRHWINSWNLKFDRVRFDIACQSAAVDESGRGLVPAAKQQVKLVCGFCAQGIARSSQNFGHGGDAATSASANDTSGEPKTMEMAKHPLTKEKAAAIGTVCPKCGRHLPRCGVCDLWLGVPDESYLKWYTQQHHQQRQQQQQDRNKANGSITGTGVKDGSVDLSASIAGSVQTALRTGGSAMMTARSRGDTAGTGTGTGTGPPSRNESPRPKPTTTATMTTEKVSASTTTTTTKPHLSSTSTSSSEPLSHPPAAAVGEAGGRRGSESAIVDMDLTLAEVDDQHRREEATRRWDATMSRFTVLCVKCAHGHHATHAKLWFDKHRVCPVPECSCLCNE